MINEPTGWSLECDGPGCKNEYDLNEDPGDEETLVAWAREDDWIMTVSDNYQARGSRE